MWIKGEKILNEVKLNKDLKMKVILQEKDQ